MLRDAEPALDDERMLRPAALAYAAGLPLDDPHVSPLYANFTEGFPTAMFTLLGYFFVNDLFGNILEPRFMGRRLGLSPLVVILSLLFWGWVLGPVGMVLSVPLTMIAKIALAADEDTRWLAYRLE